MRLCIFVCVFTIPVIYQFVDSMKDYKAGYAGAYTNLKILTFVFGFLISSNSSKKSALAILNPIHQNSETSALCDTCLVGGNDDILLHLFSYMLFIDLYNKTHFSA